MSLLLLSLLHGSGVMNPPIYRLHGATCAEDVDAQAIDPAVPLSFSGYDSGMTSCRACVLKAFEGAQFDAPGGPVTGTFPLTLALE